MTTQNAIKLRIANKEDLPVLGKVIQFGIGKTLITAAEKHARQDFGCTTSIMTILCGRDELLAWYMRAGYSDTGKTKPFPKDTGAIELVSGLYFQVLSKSLVGETQD